MAINELVNPVNEKKLEVEALKLFICSSIAPANNPIFTFFIELAGAQWASLTD
jgi:hypothetical protein